MGFASVPKVMAQLCCVARAHERLILGTVLQHSSTADSPMFMSTSHSYVLYSWSFFARTCLSFVTDELGL
uniref:Uncharacterized protein n=1 Tax=Anguilla anguilla TaxID=7936 RepID=A0A0E9W617_ANGAN